MDCREFLHFLSIWLLMSIIGGRFNKMEYWSNTLSSTENRALHRFNKWMTRHYFRDIMHTMRYADKKPPPYKNKFHGVRKLINM